MFERSDLKKSRVYQELFEEAQAEVYAKTKQRERIIILRLFNLGLNTEDIATVLDLPVTEVAATIAQDRQIQAEIKQREKVVIFRLFSRGLPTEEIATAFDLPVAEVAATIAEAQQEKSEQN
jgi:DNA-directed RNA polymerase specialized sigma24 family protein